MRFINHKKINLAIVVILLAFFIGHVCLAGLFINDDVTTEINNQTGNTSDNAGYVDTGDSGFITMLQIVVNTFLGLVGILLLIYMLYAGYNWMTARGDEEKVTKAKDTITRVIIGAVIIIASYAISVFVISKLEAGTLKPATRAYPGIGTPNQSLNT
jgi:hypothetical protein